MNESSIPAFTRGTRLRHDAARGRWVLLAPERVFVPDEIALEILRLVDGETRLAAMIDALAARFEAPRGTVSADVLELVGGLAAKGLLRG